MSPQTPAKAMTAVALTDAMLVTAPYRPLADILQPEEYRSAPERSRLFGSPGSLQWYIRTRRAELTKAGALLVVGGRVHIHAQRFDDFVLRAGAAEAAERCA